MKKILVGATLSIAVAAVIKRIAKLQNQIDVLKGESNNIEDEISGVRAEINEASLIKPEQIEGYLSSSESSTLNF